MADAPRSWSGRHVVVTGGAGFIGSHLVRRLLDADADRVTVIDSLRYGDAANLGASSPRVGLVRHTLGTDPASELRRHLAGATHLFHLAAEKHNQSKDDPVAVLRANVLGTQELFDAAATAGVRKILFTSSLYAYGRVRGAPFDEREVPLPTTVYGISKLAGEHLLARCGAEYGIAWDVLRYLFVYGPRQFAGMGYKSVIVKTLERLRDGAAPVQNGDGEQALDYIFVDDAIEATLTVMDRGASGGVFNVGSGVGTTVRSLIETMIRVSGRRATAETAPPDWTAGTRRVADTTRLEREVGFRASTSLEAGLSRTWSWICESGS